MRSRTLAAALAVPAVLAPVAARDARGWPLSRTLEEREASSCARGMEDSGHREDREGRRLIPEVISGGRSRQPAAAKRWFPARRLHLVDIENLAGGSLPSLRQVRQAQGLYADCLGFGAMDQVEVASSHLTLLNAALGWPQARYRVRSGPDGADLALLDVLRHENVATRFTHVAIGSGDHLFAHEAARLAAQGVWVTVVSRRRGLSPRLGLEAPEVIFLDTAAEAA